MTGPYYEKRDISLVEALDRTLNQGAVVAGDIIISVADVDLVYLGLRVLLSSVETMEKLNVKAPMQEPT